MSVLVALFQVTFDFHHEIMETLCYVHAVNSNADALWQLYTLQVIYVRTHKYKANLHLVKDNSNILNKTQGNPNLTQHIT